MSVNSISTFLNNEKRTGTDKNHKCYAQKYARYLIEMKADNKKRPSGVKFTRKQHAAIRVLDVGKIYQQC